MPRDTIDVLADTHRQAIADEQHIARGAETHQDHPGVGKQMLIALRDNGEVVVRAAALKDLLTRVRDAGLIDDEDGDGQTTLLQLEAALSFRA